MTKHSLLLSTSVVTVSLIIIGTISYSVASNLYAQNNSDYRTSSVPYFPSTGYIGKNDIVLASDYLYDINTGELTSSRNNKVVYTFAANQTPEKFTGRPAVYIFSTLDGSKLIIWQTDPASTLDPNQEYKLWLGNELQYLDLDNLSQGLEPYIVPESKKQEARRMFAGN